MRTAPGKVASDVRDLEIRGSADVGKWARRVRTSEAINLRPSAAATDVSLPPNENAVPDNGPCSSCFLCVCAVVAFSRSSPLGRVLFLSAKNSTKAKETQKDTQPYLGRLASKSRGVSLSGTPKPPGYAALSSRRKTKTKIDHQPWGSSAASRRFRHPSRTMGNPHMDV